MKMTFQPKKETESKSSWIQTENENCWRKKKSNRSQKIKRKKKIISIGHNFCGLFFIFDCF